MDIKQFIRKVKAYINQKYIVKYIDNEYWRLIGAEKSSKIRAVINEIYKEEIPKYYPDLDLELLQTTRPDILKFRLHNFSKYLYEISNCTIDPEYNWVILDNKHLFKYSWPLIEDPWDKIKKRPSLFAYLFRRTKNIEKGILIKYLWTNYYHFLIDTVSQIVLADKAGIPQDVPIIVPYFQKDIAFVKAFFEIMPLKRTIIVQKRNEYLNVRQLFVGKDTFFSESVKEMREFILKSNVCEKEKNMTSPELLYISRATKYKRSIKNIAEIEEIVRKYNFKVIEPGEYTVGQQIKLFSEAKVIIGVHGAGLTNLLFGKNKNIKLLEIFPGKEIKPEHYKNLCTLLGFSYFSIVGNGLDTNGQFELDTELFNNTVNDIVSYL